MCRLFRTVVAMLSGFIEGIFVFLVHFTSCVSSNFPPDVTLNNVASHSKASRLMNLEYKESIVNTSSHPLPLLPPP